MPFRKELVDSVFVSSWISWMDPSDPIILFVLEDGCFDVDVDALLELSVLILLEVVLSEVAQVEGSTLQCTILPCFKF